MTSAILREALEMKRSLLAGTARHDRRALGTLDPGQLDPGQLAPGQLA
jgi:hypothetical protein